MDVVFYSGLHQVNGFGFTAEAIHLSPSRETRFDPMTGKVATNHLRVGLVVVGCVRSRPDERHCSVENVEQLRQFIETESPKDPAENRHARVVSRCLDGVSLTRTAMRHGSKFVDFKAPIG